MRISVQSLYSQMQKDLESVAAAQTDVAQSAIAAIKTVRKYLGQLKIEMAMHPFTKKEEEIIFFKNEKPMFEKHLLYEIRRYTLETIKAEYGKGALDKQVKKEYKRIETDFNRHREFYYYYKTNSSFADEQMFTLKGAENMVYPEYTMIVDPDFSTMYGYLIACIEANDMLRNYLNIFTDKPVDASSGERHGQSFIRWTGSKTDCVEFIYGLYANGCLNNGRMDIKSIAIFVQKTFNIDLGNIYRIFQDIRIRDERTKYHNKTVTNLVSFMDYSDEHPRFT